MKEETIAEVLKIFCYGLFANSKLPCTMIL